MSGTSTAEVRGVPDAGYAGQAAVRATTSRWRVIARRQLANAWQTWWHYRLALAIAVIVACGFGGMMYFLTDSAMFRGFKWVSGMSMTVADGAVPASLQWFRRAAFVLATMSAANAFAADRQTGAFALYVVRATRPIDYVLGHIGAVAASVATLVIAGPLLLGVLRLGLYDSVAQIGAHVAILGKLLVVGLLTTAVYATVPLAISAMCATRIRAVSTWAAYWLVFGSLAGLLGAMTSGAISALDLASALDSIANQLFDIHLTKRLSIPFGLALASIAIHVALASAIIVVQARRAYRDGFGAS